MGASLSGGYVENGVVTCPWHAWRFRLTDGAWADNLASRSAATPSVSKAMRCKCKSRKKRCPSRATYRESTMNHPGRTLILVAIVASITLPAGAQDRKVAGAPRLVSVAETKLLMEGMTLPNYRGLEHHLQQKPAGVDEWTLVRGQALLVAETGNLLMLRPPKKQGLDAWMQQSADLRSAAPRWPARPPPATTTRAKPPSPISPIPVIAAIRRFGAGARWAGGGRQTGGATRIDTRRRSGRMAGCLARDADDRGNGSRAALASPP